MGKSFHIKKYTFNKNIRYIGIFFIIVAIIGGSIFYVFNKNNAECKPLDKSVVSLVANDKGKEAYSKLKKSEKCSSVQKESFSTLPTSDKLGQFYTYHELAVQAYKKGDRKKAVQLATSSQAVFDAMSATERDNLQNFVGISMDIMNIKNGTL